MTEVVSLHQNTDEQGYCLTPTARGITGLLNTCQEHRLLGVIIGEPGTGKTTAIEGYAKNNDEVFLCRMTKATSAIQPMLVRLYQCIGGYAPGHSGASELYQNILDSLSRYVGTNLLILDEAQHLSDDAIEGVRDLFDEAKIGVVLVGNSGLSSRWAPPKTNSTRSSAKYSYFAQLRGRIGQFLEILKPLKQDLQALCDYHGIESKEARGLIEKVANAPGHLHNVDNLLRVASGTAGSGSRLNYRSLQDAAQLTGVL